MITILNGTEGCEVIDRLYTETARCDTREKYHIQPSKELSIKDVRKNSRFDPSPLPVRKCPTWPPLTLPPPPPPRPHIRGRGWPIYVYITLISSVSRVYPKGI